MFKLRRKSKALTVNCRLGRISDTNEFQSCSDSDRLDRLRPHKITTMKGHLHTRTTVVSSGAKGVLLGKMSVIDSWAEKCTSVRSW